MKITVHVIYKKEILDPQGQTVKNALLNLGFKNLIKVRQGKYFELEVSDFSGKIKVNKQVKQMCDKLLVNSVMEDYTITIHENKK